MSDNAEEGIARAQARAGGSESQQKFLAEQQADLHLMQKYLVRGWAAFRAQVHQLSSVRAVHASSPVLDPSRSPGDSTSCGRPALGEGGLRRRATGRGHIGFPPTQPFEREICIGTGLEPRSGVMPCGIGLSPPLSLSV